jgi:hypothetical protein
VYERAHGVSPSPSAGLERRRRDDHGGMHACAGRAGRDQRPFSTSPSRCLTAACTLLSSGTP